MKKALLFCTAALVIASATLTGFSAYNRSETARLLRANIEALSNNETQDPGESSECGYCYSGGRGATACSVEAGTEIFGFGASAGCSVSCSGSYYACCSLRCICC